MKTNLLLLLLASSAVAVSNASSDGNKLVVIMIDGFRWDYANRSETPNLTKFSERGVAAEYVQPIFPSVSFPSWTSIATGLYPESHGIVGNYMLDEQTGKEFDLTRVSLAGDTTGDPIWWSKHVPLWISATEAGIRTALFGWSRCDVEFEGILPDKCILFDNIDCLNLTVFEEYAAEAVDDLEDGYGLVFLYYGNVDEMGHEYGPDSPEVDRELEKVDSVLGKFFLALEKNGLGEKTDIMIVADHGMTDLSDKTFRPLSEFVDPSHFRKVVHRGPFAYISLKDKSKIDEVAEQLKRWKGMRVFNRSEIPSDYHLGGDDRVLDLLLVTEGQELIGWDGPPRIEDYLPAGAPNVFLGNHGWDDSNEDMRSIFMAAGPSFKRGLRHNWISLVDEYQVMAFVLGIPARPNNGSWERVQDMLTERSGGVQSPKGVHCAVCFLAIIISQFFRSLRALWP